MKKYKAVIFDVDGVLLSTEIAMKSAMIKVLEKRGISPKIKDFYYFSGVGEEAAIQSVAKMYNIPYEASMKDESYHIYAREMQDKVTVYRDILKTFDALKNAGYRIAVASSADKVKVDVNFRRIGVGYDIFDAVICGSDIKEKKPSPEIYIKAADALGLYGSDCVAVEDALAGVKSALGAGMDCIGVSTSFSKEQLTESGCVFVTDETCRITEYLL